MKVYISRFEEDIEDVFLSMNDLAEHALALFQEAEYEDFLYNINLRNANVENAIKEAKEYAMQEYAGRGNWFQEKEVIT